MLVAGIEIAGMAGIPAIFSGIYADEGKVEKSC
jgi:hypothetical protein